jgi:3-hydroxybutyryl-CoA dehydrogenase
MMRIAVITNDVLKEELLALGIQEHMNVTWLSKPLPVKDTDCYLDLLFQQQPQRIDTLKKLSEVPGGQPATIIINDVTRIENSLPEKFIRINGWNSFLKRPVVEAAGKDQNERSVTENVFAGFNRSVEWTPDQPGFITARVVTMIINEAYFTLGEKVSTREEIDTAMKTGTNYPYGPFEWSQLIGIKKVHELLIALSQKNSRYAPAPLLTQEALPE